MTASTSAPRPDSGSLRAAWSAAQTGTRPARPYDLAADLGVSELELVSARTGLDVVRLTPAWDEVLPALAGLGQVMGLTRNAHAVIEKDGRWSPFSRHGSTGLVLDEGLDLRLFLGPWAHLLAVTSATRHGPRRSLQVFDAHGVALHKVFVREGADAASAAGYDALVERFRAPDQSPSVTISGHAAQATMTPDDRIDVDGFRAAWLALQDAHDFFGLLRRFGVTRTQALRLAPAGHARPLGRGAARAVLEHAAASGLPIMVFVGNRGCIGIHTGPVRSVKVMGPWLNVLDPGFNLHLREDRIASAWLVTKPTSDGPVTSVELFDAVGDNIALLFGKRKPGIPEDPAWRVFAQSLS